MKAMTLMMAMMMMMMMTTTAVFASRGVAFYTI
jgi:hypothetical protein